MTAAALRAERRASARSSIVISKIDEQVDNLQKGGKDESVSEENTALKEMIGKQISVITCDGRNIVGTLRGYDQVTNVILEECHERVYSLDAGVEQVVLGLYIIRGDNIAIIGEIDPERDAKTDLSKVRAEAMKPVSHS